MAKSRYEYVKKFEDTDRLLLNTWLVVRIDGRGFHRFTETHRYEKPSDVRGLTLMNVAAEACMKEFGDIVLSYGESDEYSFVLKKEASLFGRRASKITTAIVSYFTAVYVMRWPDIMQSKDGTPEPLQYPPQFDGRIVCYPSRRNVRDYLCWRQADTHINNLFNTCFWALVLKGNMTEVQAEQELKGTFSKDKHEILFSRFGINYNKENAMFRKGTTLIWQLPDTAGSEARGDDGVQASVPGPVCQPKSNPLRGQDDQQPELTAGGAATGADSGADALPQDANAAGSQGGERQPAGADQAKKYKSKKKPKKQLRTLYEDLIGEDFWQRYPDIIPVNTD